MCLYPLYTLLPPYVSLSFIYITAPSEIATEGVSSLRHFLLHLHSSVQLQVSSVELQVSSVGLQVSSVEFHQDSLIEFGHSNFSPSEVAYSRDTEMISFRKDVE